MNINIAPALQIDEKKNLSAEEFQKELCSWLESRGLLCELRAYFRSNMIEVLKNTALGSTISCKVKQTISPKMQAMNLLISEYFIYSQYHFSLCVFCTEVSLNHMLPESSNMSVVNKREENFKFSEKEVYDILEAVGMLRYNKQAQRIYTSYSELNEPLISYFLPSSSICDMVSNEQINYLDDNGDMDYEFINGNIDKIITNSNLSPSESSGLIYFIKMLYDKQREKENKVIEALKEKYRDQLKKYRNKLNEIQQSFENERRNFQKDINCMKEELESMFLQNKLIKIRERSHEPPKITSVHEELQQTEVITKQESTSAHINVEDKSTQWVEEKPKKAHKIDQEQQTITNTNLETAVLKHVVHQLEKENSNLRTDNFSYCEQIDELANRASILMNELNISQQNIVRLNNLLQNSPSVFAPRNIAETRQSLHFTGAGEECSGAYKPTTPRRTYRHLSKDKKSSKKLTPSSGSSSGKTSPTDNLLQEAKTRLKNLELESEDIDRTILTLTERFDFATNQTQNKREQNVRKPFNFNTFQLEEAQVFEFGTSSAQKESNTESECTSRESQSTVTNGNISSIQLDFPETSDED